MSEFLGGFEERLGHAPRSSEKGPRCPETGRRGRTFGRRESRLLRSGPPPAQEGPSIVLPGGPRAATFLDLLEVFEGFQRCGL
eukprot:6477612-Pyramimonas_sp.AAC.1